MIWREIAMSQGDRKDLQAQVFAIALVSDGRRH